MWMKKFIEAASRSHHHQYIERECGRYIQPGTCIEQGRIMARAWMCLKMKSLQRILNKESGLYQRLFNLKQVVLSPHIAGWTHESKFKMASVLIQKIFAHIHHQ